MIGRVERTNTGNTALSIGQWRTDGSWEKAKGDAGHIVLSPQGRWEPIAVLLSHDNTLGLPGADTADYQRKTLLGALAGDPETMQIKVHGSDRDSHWTRVPAGVLRAVAEAVGRLHVDRPSGA